MNKTITTILVLAALVIGAVLLFGADGGDANEGTIVFAVTDAAADMENITAVDMTIDGVDLQTTNGTWIQATTENETFSLLELDATNRLALLARTTANADTYDAVRLHVSDVTVTTNDGTESTAVLASDKVVIEGQVTVNDKAETEVGTDNQTETVTVVTFDVQADESLHVTTADEFIFAPVVQMEAQSDASVEVTEATDETETATVTVANGTTTATVLVGIDTEGESRMNFMLDSSEGIEVNNDGSLQLLGNIDSETEATTTEDETESDAEVEVGATTSVEVDDEVDAEVETETDTEAETPLY